MRTLILFDRLGRELLPLTDRTPVALLPVAAKPLAEHTLEALATAGIGGAMAVIGPHGEDVRTHVGTGQRWGVNLEFLLGRGEEDPATLLRQLPAANGEPWLVIRGDILTAPLLPAFLRQAADTAGAVLHAVAGGRPAGICLIREHGSTDAASALRWDRLGNTVAGASPPDGPTLALDAPGVRLLDSLADFHQSNLDAMAGRIGGLHLPGRETAIGLRQGRHTTVDPRSLTVGKALVGNQCRIHPSARLSDEVVIADQVIIDREARLSRAVVLPQTYIGELVTVSHAIVRGNDLIDIETGGIIRIVDAFLLADLREAPLRRGLSGGLNRAMGGALLLLSLPLWPLAALAALLENPRRPLRGRRLRGNRVEQDTPGQSRRREFMAWEWATRIPPLARLPWLWPVARGDLRLVGVEAVSREAADQRRAEWELLADGSPAGLIGPTQLFLGADAPAEERLMSDAFFASQADPAKELSILWNALILLLRPRTWWPAGNGTPPA